MYQLGSPYQTICIFFSRHSLIIKPAMHAFLGSLCFSLSVLSPEDWPGFHKAVFLPALALPYSGHL